jgi:Tat protein translocase TatB subunit
MNLGMPEMIFIFLLALVVVGPRKLPELGRQLGKFLAEFKRASNEFKNQLETEMLNIELEERAKKQEEGPKILPPDRTWERPIMPASGAVSRANPELVSIEGDDSQVMKPLSPPSNTAPDQQPSPARSAVSE